MKVLLPIVIIEIITLISSTRTAPSAEDFKENLCLDVKKAEVMGELVFERQEKFKNHKGKENVICFEKRKIMNNRIDNSGAKSTCAWNSNHNLTQRAEAILNNFSNNINKTHTGLISVLQGFQKCIA